MFGPNGARRCRPSAARPRRHQPAVMISGVSRAARATMLPIPTWRLRRPLLADCWIAMAENVAPKRFRIREQRRRGEHQGWVLDAIPSFVLPPFPSDKAAKPGASVNRSVRYGAAEPRGAFARRRPSAVTIPLASTSQRVPGSGQVRITSQPRCGDMPDERERALRVHGVLAGAGLAEHPGVELREIAIKPQPAHPLMAVRDDAWLSCVVVVEGEPIDFKRVTFDDHWLALGSVGEFYVTIESHGYDATPLELVRLKRPGSG